LFSFHQFLKFFGITSFSVEATPLIFPIKNKMKDQRKFNKYFYSVSFVMFGITALLSVLVYKIYGEKLEYIYVMNLAYDSMVARTILTMFSLAIYLNMPFMAFPFYEIIVRDRKFFQETFSKE
jgi:amino acid permease